MSTLSTTNIKHPSSASNNLVLTSGGATQIAGLTYPIADGTNGQYLKTTGSGSLSWATLPAAGWTNHGQTATTSGSLHTVTGISTNARVVRIAYSNISTNSTTTPHLRLQMGNGSLNTADYYWHTQYGSYAQTGTADSSIRLLHTDFYLTDNYYAGVIDIVAEQTYMVGYHVGFMTGSWRYDGVFRWAGGGSIDRIAIGTASTFDSGHFVVYSL